MIKVREGQVWEFEKGADNYESGDRLRIMDLDRPGAFHDAKPINIVDPSDIYSVTPEFLNECFRFIPQNDLEKLAINETEWFHSGCDWVRLDEYDRPMYTSEIDHPLNQDYHYTHRTEWQNMRYHLGQDKKPHYRLTKCEWVKQ